MTKKFMDFVVLVRSCSYSFHGAYIQIITINEAYSPLPFSDCSSMPVARRLHPLTL